MLLMNDARKEIEYQKTNRALGKAVDLDSLFEILDECHDEMKEAVAAANTHTMEAQGLSRRMSDSILDANAIIDKAMNAITIQITDRLKQIDRNEVVRVLKEVIIQIRTAQSDLNNSRFQQTTPTPK